MMSSLYGEVLVGMEWHLSLCPGQLPEEAMWPDTCFRKNIPHVQIEGVLSPDHRQDYPVPFNFVFRNVDAALFGMISLYA